MRKHAALALLMVSVAVAACEPRFVCSPVQAVESSAQTLSSDDFVEKGKACRKKGDTDGALTAYSEALHLNPLNAEAYKARAALRSAYKDFPASLSDWDAAISLDPNDAVSYFERGGVKEDLGDFAFAGRDYTQALRIDPDYLPARFNRARVWLGENIPERLKLGVADCDFVIAHNYKVNETKSVRGVLRRKTGDIKGGIEDSSAALAADPKDAYSLGNLAICNAMIGNYDESIRQVAEAEKISPKINGLHIDLGELMLERGLVFEAKALFERATKIFPNGVEAWMKLGSCLESNGSPVPAEATYRKVLQLDPQNLTALTSLADVQRMQGKFPEARNTVVRMRTIAPQSGADVLARIDSKNMEEFPFLTGEFDTTMDYDGRQLPATLDMKSYTRALHRVLWKCLSGETVEGIGIRGFTTAMAVAYETPSSLNVMLVRWKKGKHYIISTGTGSQVKGKVSRRWISKDSPAEEPPAVTPEANVVGTYDISGDAGGGENYTGTLTITKSGEAYAAKWKTSGSEYSGPAVLSGQFLAIAFKGTTKPGVMLYVVAPSGNMRGTWAYVGSKVFTAENAVRKK